MKYTDAFDLASTVIMHRRRRATYPEGAAREMALAILAVETEKQMIEVMSSIGARLEIPVRHTGRWDGSIA